MYLFIENLQASHKYPQIPSVTVILLLNTKSELQIRGSIEDNSKIIFLTYFSMKTYVVTPH